MGRIVAKFGGTSMGSADAMRKASAIVRSLGGEPIVVVSAVGGMTTALIALSRVALADGDWRAALGAIRVQHEGIIADLGLDLDLEGFWSEAEKICQGVAMLGELSSSTLDRLQSFGERVSATIFAAQLRRDDRNAETVDAIRIIATDNQFGSANVDFETTNARMTAVLSPMLAESVIPVVTGFIGQSESGAYATLGRGGSDYSGAIIAAAMDATELQIWTDVDGMFTADPRLIPSATAIPQLSFAEAGELAYFGAKVLHPKTIRPAIEKNIPVRILNTFNPAAQGTRITNEERSSVKSVTSKRGVTVVNLCSLDMLGAYGFLAKVFDAFALHKVVVDVLSSSEVSISVTVDGGIPSILVDNIRAFATVEVEAGMAIVCIVGEGIRTQPDILGKLFTAVGSAPVSMVSQGASKRNVTFVVAESDAKSVVKRVFRTFFEPSLL